LGAYLATRGTYWPMLAGAFLFQMQSILDGCDGEMSRVTYRGSHLGEWLDTVGDDLTNYGFFGATAWGMYVASGWWLYLAAGAVTVGCGLVTSAIEYRYLYKIGSGDLLKYPLGVGSAPTTSQVQKGTLARALDAIAPMFKRDTFVLLTFVGAVAGLLGPFLLAFACGGVGILFAVLKAELRMARERRVSKSNAT
jgi:1L-myo-inositol 1-phosphate cytidylyltransferase / CDP-L-myo-inositol myo-inositolphosphotransferase